MRQLNFYRLFYTDGPDSVNFNDSTSKSVVEGSSYAVMCSCQTCEPGCSVVWKKDQSSGGLLKFDNLSRTDDGSYECSCTNTAVHSKTKSNTLDLNVQCEYMSTETRISPYVTYSYLSNKFHFSEVHRSMNATGHVQSK